jgi:hypothetical protein
MRICFWGVALSADDNYIHAVMAIKAEEVCNTNNKVSNSFNPLSKDVALAVNRLSLHPRMQFHQQTHKPGLMGRANASVQQSLDEALNLVTGLELLSPTAYSLDPATLPDPTLGEEMVRQPARLKGCGLRRIDEFVGDAAYVGGLELVSRRFIDSRGEDGVLRPGLYPLLEPLFGAGSQDHGQEDRRFATFINGTSALGNSFRDAFDSLKALCPDAEAGPLSVEVEAVRPVSSKDPKLQRDITKQIEDTRAIDLAKRHQDLAINDRRKVAYKQRLTSTTGVLTSVPTKATQTPQHLFTGAVALVMGAIDPRF